MDPFNFFRRNSTTTFDPSLWNRVAGNPVESPSNGINASASSRGGAAPFDQPTIDWSKADPAKLKSFGAGNYTYDVSAGGYISNQDASNANSYYIKHGVSDPNADRQMQALRDYVSTLPTKAVGTPALNDFNQRFGNPQQNAQPNPQPLPQVFAYHPNWR